MNRDKSNFILSFFTAVTRFLLVFSIIILQFFSDEAIAKSEAEKNKKPSLKSNKEAPTRIRSDIIDIKRKSQTIDFLGNVAVEKEDSSLLAKKMTVIYEEKSAQKPKSKSVESKIFKEEIAKDEEKSSLEPKPKKESSIKRIDAKEDVKIFSEEFIATGNTGYYDPSENIFVLEKNVMVNNGTSIANGDKFIYHLDTKKGNFVGKSLESSVIGEEVTDKRVMMVIGDDLKTQKTSKKSNKNKKEKADD